MQPRAYNYLSHLKRHLGDLNRLFKDRPVYPRQLQIYLPGNHKIPCNFRCHFCSGRLIEKKLIPWEEEGLKLLHNLRGAVPYHMYSGAYTEPLLNPYLMRFLSVTKRYGSSFGIKTNGSFMLDLEKRKSFLSEVCAISNSEEDFFAVSLDAGFAKTHSEIKRVAEKQFYKVIDGLELLSDIRGDSRCPAIRITYLLTDQNDTLEEIESAIGIAKRAKVDSIRFCQPHPPYGVAPRNAESLWEMMAKANANYLKIFEPLVSTDREERPFVFYAEPYKPSEFKVCAYGYYQIDLSADGYLYKCTTVDTLKPMRLGRITSDIKEFKSAIFRNQDPDFDPQECYKLGTYCCRAGIAVNRGVGES